MLIQNQDESRWVQNRECHEGWRQQMIFGLGLATSVDGQERWQGGEETLQPGGKSRAKASEGEEHDLKRPTRRATQQEVRALGEKPDNQGNCHPRRETFMASLVFQIVTCLNLIWEIHLAESTCRKLTTFLFRKILPQKSKQINLFSLFLILISNTSEYSLPPK